MEPYPLQHVQDYLRMEGKNRVLNQTGHGLYDCLQECIDSLLVRRRRYEQSAETENELNGFRTVKELKAKTISLLKDHSKKFQVVLSLLVDESPMEGPTGGKSNSKEYIQRLEEFYIKVVSKCEGEAYHNYINVCLYAVSTCINTPIFIVTFDKEWQFIQPLFEYQGQPKGILTYITMYLSPGYRFHRIESTDHTTLAPTAVGIIGMYMKLLEEVPVDSISLPQQLIQLGQAARLKLCKRITRATFHECWELLKQNGRLSEEEYRRLTAFRCPLEKYHTKILGSQEYFETLCKVLIKRKKKDTLTACGLNWDVLVTSCKHLLQVGSLIALDKAVLERNEKVRELVDACLLGEKELNERRQNVTSTVIASSSVGIISGGLVIAGIAFAPFSFGASLGLGVVGGVIGVGSGIASGTARVVETVKQNSKLKDVQRVQDEIREKEEKVSVAVMQVEQGFKELLTMSEGTAKNTSGISQHGLLVLGSALRSVKSVASIYLAAARIGSTAAKVSAAILGPLSLVLDVAFLAEAAQNKMQGDKTEAGVMLRSMAETVDMKCKIFNNILRGSFDVKSRMFDWSE